jgi:hypothetical protein
MIGAMRELYVRHANVDYAGLVRRCKARKSSKRDADGVGLEPISQRSVFRLVGQIVKELLPSTIIGSEHNQGVLLRRKYQYANTC